MFLTSSQNRARHERLGVKQQTWRGVEQVSEEQINEWISTASVDMNARSFEVIKADFPEVFPLMGVTLAVTGRQFADAGLTETLQAAMGKCKEEQAALSALALLFWVKKNTPSETV